jgi:hypothetical protein
MSLLTSKSKLRCRINIINCENKIWEETKTKALKINLLWVSNCQLIVKDNLNQIYSRLVIRFNFQFQFSLSTNHFHHLILYIIYSGSRLMWSLWVRGKLLSEWQQYPNLLFAYWTYLRPGQFNHIISEHIKRRLL